MQTQQPLQQPTVDSGEIPVIRSLRRRGFRYLHVIDAVTIYGLMVAITVARFGFSWPTYPVSHYLIGFAIATAVHMVMYYFGGLYEYEQRLGLPPWLPRIVALTAVSVLISAAIGLATNRYLMPRLNLAVLAVAATVSVALARAISRRLRSRRYGHSRVLLVGTPDDISLARAHLAESGGDTEVVGQTPNAHALLSECNRVGATDVLLLSGGSLDKIYPDPLDDLERRRVGVFYRISPSDTLLGLQRSRQIAGMPFVALRTRAVPNYRLRLKRILELAVIAVLSPIIVLVALGAALYVRLRVGKGVLYRQERVGRAGTTFTMLKFRSMRHDAESAGAPVLADEDDPRVVPGMRWMRESRLDELPQLINVLRGEMSLVGPRPERPEFVANLEELIPGYGRRHDLPPGITGLAQIRGHYQTDPGYKLGHDLQYVVNWSPILDLQILAETLLVMLRRSAR
ncbi:MAG: exopolysaccharide biosynthesis polyprenyl glycosylphosphotransferase [Acidimicrobiales bacterium]|nr:exopolysaccharide biosynthesis polyprenyl glycosylphosphotransferase [Acidimicrobiales bacterium]